MMTVSIKRMLLTALVAVTPIFTACERVDEISGVTDGPNYSVGDNGNAFGVGKKAGPQALRHTVSQSGSVSVWLSTGMSYTLELNGYSLRIPKGASRGVTQYVMSLVPITDAEGNTYQLVRLNAFDHHSNPITTFRAGLRLTIPFANADPDQLTDESKLRIGYVADGTTSILEVIQVSIDSAAQTMTGSITHFSDYTPILD